MTLQCGHLEQYCYKDAELEFCSLCELVKERFNRSIAEKERDAMRFRFEAEQKRVIELLDDLLALRKQVRKWEARATAAGGNEAQNAAEMQAFLRKETEQAS